MRSITCILTSVWLATVAAGFPMTAVAGSTAGMEACRLPSLVAAAGLCGDVPPCLNGDVLKFGYSRKFK